MDFEHSSPFTVYPKLRKLLGAYNHVVLLSRIIDDSKDGVLITTNDELEAKCCLTKREVQYSKKIILEKVKFIRHKYFGFPRKSRYTIDMKSFYEYACDERFDQEAIEDLSKPEESVAPIKRQKPKRDHRQYPNDFEEVWEMYQPPLKNAKGTKKNAFRAYEKVVETFGRDKLIEILQRYMDSDMFKDYPAHLATFFNGLLKDTKYKRSFVDMAYEKRVAEKNSKREHPKGELDAKGLIHRTNEIQKELFTKYGTSPTIIEHRPREEWVKFLGPEYITIKIPHYMNKTAKVNVLFHIDELRANLYTHIHGIVWDDTLEEKYQELNHKQLGGAA